MIKIKMKKIIITVLCAIMVFSLVGCKSKPSDAEIKEALDQGTITVEDAIEKGWIDQAWMDKNFEKVDPGSKIHLFDSFETIYLDGTPAFSDMINGIMCLVFFNTEDEDTMNKLTIFNEMYNEMSEIGVPILGINTDKDYEAAREKLKDIKFPIIVYNDDMNKAMKDYKEMLETGVISVFTKEGGFYSAWNLQVNVDEMLDFARRLVDEK